MNDAPKYYLEPGYIFVSTEPHLIHTVLGSCISVCLWDSVHRFGGMNHFIYSRTNGPRNAKYGDVSVPHLIRLMLQLGSDSAHLKAHIVGGGFNPALSTVIGNENARVAEEILQKNKIEITSTDIGGAFGRKLIFDNATGEILVYKGIEIRKSDWYSED